MRPDEILLQIAKQGKEASKKLRLYSTEQKNQALLAIADALELHQKEILAANAQDLQQPDLSDASLDRLSLKGNRLQGIVNDVRKVASLPDPVGEILFSSQMENGLKLSKIRVPIGVIGVIYESRPNVTVDIASLCLKTSNCAILRGGKETLNTNIALMHAVREGLQKAGFPREIIQFIENPKREYIKQLVKLDKYLDMIIPRGGEGLHRFCLEESTIPVITGGIGICHLFVDDSADLAKSIEVIFNAKTQRPSVCNSLDTLLVHKQIAPLLLYKLLERLKEYAMTYRLDPKAWEILGKEKNVAKAIEQDWRTEWLGLTLGIKIVDSLQEAIDHIQCYSSNHSDGILTNSSDHAKAFTDAIDSCAVYVNASTRFTDGSQFGLGAEVAVSTQKLHARGPMGLKELTTYKWIGEGNYHIRENS